MASRTLLNYAIAAALTVPAVKADYGWGGRGGRGWNGNSDGNDDSDGSGNGGGSDAFTEQNGFGLGSEASFDRANTILIAHGVVASAVWVLFVPWAALLLRLNLKNPIVLKLHAFFQILAYLVYIAGVGMGIWLAQQIPSGIWGETHPRLGLAILAIAFFQPIFGFVHHRTFKRRTAAVSAGTATKAPGRTVFGHIHLWVGRSLIILGIVNGGLGIRLASSSPFRTDSETRTAGIVYGVIAGVMFALYAALVILFEIRRKRAQGQAAPVAQTHTKDLPTYDESQSSATSLASRQNTGGNNLATPDNGANAPRYS